MGVSPADHSLVTRSSCALSEVQCHYCSTSGACSSSQTTCFRPPTAEVGLLETSYDDTYEATSRSRARSLSLYSLEGAPLVLSPFSRHRSLNKHLAASLVSSRTSASRTDAGPRVCPFCPTVTIPRQALILPFECLFSFCGFDVSFSTPSLDFLTPTIHLSVFVKDEKLVKAFPLQCVRPNFVLGSPDHPGSCIVQISSSYVCPPGVPCIY